MVYHCTGCDAITLQPLGITKKAKNDKNFKHSLPNSPAVGIKCIHCGGNHHVIMLYTKLFLSFACFY